MGTWRGTGRLADCPTAVQQWKAKSRGWFLRESWIAVGTSVPGRCDRGVISAGLLIGSSQAARAIRTAALGALCSASTGGLLTGWSSPALQEARGLGSVHLGPVELASCVSPPACLLPPRTAGNVRPKASVAGLASGIQHGRPYTGTGISTRGTQDTASSPVHFRLHGSHILWPRFPAGSPNVRFGNSTYAVLQPPTVNNWVWVKGTHKELPCLAGHRVHKLGDRHDG
jgi:hypothetical protein